jgi:hypothetical protein
MSEDIRGEDMDIAPKTPVRGHQRPPTPGEQSQRSQTQRSQTLGHSSSGPSERAQSEGVPQGQGSGRPRGPSGRFMRQSEDI